MISSIHILRYEDPGLPVSRFVVFFVQKVPNYEISRSRKGTQLQMLKDFPRVLVNVGRCWGLFGHLRQIKAKQIFDLGHDTKHTMEIII